MKPITRIFLLLALASFFACSRETETPKQEAASPPATDAPKSSEEKLQDIHANIKALKTELAQDGKYVCCIDESCNFCLLHEGSCPCLKELENGEHVCVECYAGWQQDRGIAKNIKKEQVTTSFLKHEHKH